MVTRIEPIRGKVARILNSREVALNIGREQGVKPGMFLEILSPKGFEIPDPDTGEILGSVALPKVRVKITRIEDNVSVASTYRTKRVTPGKPPLNQTIKWETYYESLKNQAAFEKAMEDLDEADSYVSTGDPVVQVLDGED